MQPQRGTKERRPPSKRPLKKLEGKTFYLDNVKKNQTTTLCEAIDALGGRLESFLHKDVSFVVTESKGSLKQDKPVAVRDGSKKKSEEPNATKREESCLSREKQRPGTPRPLACGSRGKALLEKAIRNNERLQASSVLSSAQSWGVKILSVEDALLYLKRLTKESSIPKQCSPVVKASTLNAPYLKIEDFNRKYKPLFTLYTTFPGLCHLGRCSPLGTPPPPWSEQWVEQIEHKPREKRAKSVAQEKSPSPHSLPWLICKKDMSYCECCRQNFSSLKEHLQSDLHRSFAVDPSNYSMVDEVGAEMFDPNLFKQFEETLNRPSTLLPVEEVCEKELHADAEQELGDHNLPRQDPPFMTLTVGGPRSPLPCSPAEIPPSTEFAAPNPEDVPPDIQPFTVEANFEIPDSQSSTSSPPMPVLHREPPVQPSLLQPAEIQQLSSFPLSDPYSLPPVLSPQVPSPSHSMDPYSEPPVLSPHQYTAEENAVGQPWERTSADIASTLVSDLTETPSPPPLIPATLTDAGEVNRTHQEAFSRLLCSDGGLGSSTPPTSGSNSSAQLLAVAANPRKRHRSADSENGHRKHKTKITCGDGSSWTGGILEATKPQSDISAEVECDIQITQSSSIPYVFLTAGQLAKETLSCYTYHLTAPGFTQAPNQSDSLACQPLRPTSSKAAATDPARDLTCSKSSSSLRNRDSLHSQSLFTSIEPSLIPNPSALPSSSSDSEWDCGLLSRLAPAPAASVAPAAPSRELDTELLHRPCPWMYDSSYESHLHSILQPSTPAAAPCGDEKDISSISRSVAQTAEVQ